MYDEDIYYLIREFDELYPKIRLNSINKARFKNRSDERIIYDKLLAMLLSENVIDPEEVLFIHEITKHFEKRYFYNNNKRLSLILLELEVINNMILKLKSFRGEL